MAAARLWGRPGDDGSQNLVFAVIPMIGKHTVQLRPIDENEQEDEDAGNKNRGSRK